jgi:hypothetical protein
MNPWAKMYDDLRDKGLSHEQAVASVERQRSGAEGGDTASQRRSVVGGLMNAVAAGNPVGGLFNAMGMDQGDAASSVLQGGSAGFKDELAGVGAALIPGGKGYTEGRDASRANTARIREEHPIASRVAEGVGGGTLPIGATSTLGGRLAGGALSGGLFGVGEGEGLEERAIGGGVGAVLGAAGAGLFHGVERGVKALRTNTTARGLAEKVGIAGGARGGKIGPAQETARAEVERVRRELYKPLEKEFAQIDDPALLQVLKQKDIRNSVRAVIGSKQQPSFTDLQAIQNNLRGRAKAAAHGKRGDLAERYRVALDHLTEQMEAKMPGVREANAAYRRAKEVEIAFDKGLKAFGPSRSLREEVLQKELEKMGSVEARDAMRAGISARIFDTLDAGGEVTAGQIRFIERPKLRSMFADDEAYKEFIRELEQVKRAKVVKGVLRKSWKPAAIAGTVVAAVGGKKAASLFNFTP